MKRTFSLLSLPSLLLLYVVVLAQLGLTVHELGHALEGEQAGCVSCLLSDHQSTLLINADGPVALAYQPIENPTLYTGSLQQPRVCYASRAPPFA